MMERNAARNEVETWVRVELAKYADAQKWDRTDRHHTEWDEVNQAWWEAFVLQYVSRSKTLSGTPGGQQALLKALVTLFEMCVTMWIASDGEVPLPGHPSGEIIFGRVDD